MTEHQEDMLEQLKNSKENIALTIGVLLSMTLVAYFLSYSELANSEHMGLFWFEMISSIFIVAGLFKIHSLAFALLKLRYMGNTDMKALLASLTVDDLS